MAPQIDDSSTMEVIQLVNQEMKDMHPSYDSDKFEAVAKTYIACIDKEGFVFDFNQAWKMAGYSKKSNAKRVLTKKLEQNVDYKIFKFGETLPSHITTILPSTMPGSTLSRPNESWDYSSETIVLTARGMNQFCLGAGTEVGTMLRDFVLTVMRKVKRFEELVRNGDIRVQVRKRKPEDETLIENRTEKRLKVCDTVKNLMAVIKSRPEKFQMPVYAQVNGMTNKAVTGYTKKELATKLEKPVKAVNQRDYMDRDQLIATAYIEMMSAKHIEKAPDNCDPLNLHNRVLNANSNFFGVLHKETPPQRHTLIEARKHAKAIEDAKPQAKPERKATGMTIQRYFIKT